MKIETPSLHVHGLERRKRRKLSNLNNGQDKDDVKDEWKDYSSQIQKIQKRLRHITSPAYFRMNTIHKYRQHMKDSLIEVMKFSRIKPKQEMAEIFDDSDENLDDLVDFDHKFYFNYNHLVVESCLFSGISWKELCRNHDQHMITQRQSSSQTSLSPLQEVLNILIQEYIHFQTYMTVPLILILFKVLISSYSFHLPHSTINSKISPSISLLQTTLRKSLKHCPPIALLSRHLCRCIQQNLLIATSMSSTQIVTFLIKEVVHRSIWFIQVLLQQGKSDQRRGLGVGQCVVHTFIQALGDVQFNENTETNHSGLTTNSKALHNKNVKDMEHPKTKYQSRSVHLKQHDIDFHEINGENDVDGSGISIRMKDIAGSTYHRVTITPLSQKGHQNQIANSNSTNFSSFRVTIIEGIISILHILTLNCHREFELGITFNSIIDSAMDSPTCSMKWLIVILSATCDIRSTYEQGLEIVLRRIFKKYCECMPSTEDGRHCHSISEQDLKQREDFIRIYTEIVVDCKAMEALDRCWRALSPLLDKVFSLSQTRKDSHKKHIIGIIQHTLLRAISHILAHRASLLAKDMNRFEATLYKLSTHFGSSEDLWISLSASVDEKNKILCMLRSFLILQKDMSGDLEINQQCEQCIGDSWSFHKSSRLQYLYSCDKSLKTSPTTSGLLSCHDCLKETNFAKEYYETKKTILQNEKEKLMKHKVTRPTVPLLEYLNEDITRIIFSFLGYKRIIRAMGVCKSWFDLGNDSKMLWKEFYMKRWPQSVMDETMSEKERNQMDWKQIFVEKWKLERSLRSKFSKDLRWKFRSCNVVGCSKILRQKSFWDKHILWHQEKIEKAKRKERDRERKAALKKENTKKNQDRKSKSVSESRREE